MADISSLKRAKDETEATAWMTVMWWPGTSQVGTPIADGDGEPFQILVRNKHCREMKEAEKTFAITRQVRLAIEETNGHDKLQKGMDTANAIMDFGRTHAERILVRDWRNWSDAGVPVACTPAAIAQLFDNAPEIYDQVYAFADDGTNYGQKKSEPQLEPLEDIQKKSSSGISGDSDADSATKTATASEI